jgi:hypothetical protein
VVIPAATGELEGGGVQLEDRVPIVNAGLNGAFKFNLNLPELHPLHGARILI